MQKVGFKIRVDPTRLAEYRRLHDPIWPELADALRDAGIRNYTLWLDEPTATEFGYLECDDWDDVCRRLAASEVHARWQELMKAYLLTPADAGRGGQPVTMLERVFTL